MTVPDLVPFLVFAGFWFYVVYAVILCVGFVAFNRNAHDREESLEIAQKAERVAVALSGPQRVVDTNQNRETSDLERFQQALRSVILG